MADLPDYMMSNANPPRKAFSSSPVPEASDPEHSPQNLKGDMKVLKSLAKAIKKNGKLKTPNS